MFSDQLTRQQVKTDEKTNLAGLSVTTLITAMNTPRCLIMISVSRPGLPATSMSSASVV